MKIQTDIQSITDKKYSIVQGNKESSVTFKGQMETSQAQLSDKVRLELLDKIEKQGQRLLTNQTVKEFQLYKKLVQSFVTEAVKQGLNLKQSKNLLSQNGTKSAIVQKVNQKLLDLTDHFLNHEQQSINILQQLDEVKGMLINLYG